MVCLPGAGGQVARAPPGMFQACSASCATGGLSDGRHQRVRHLQDRGGTLELPHPRPVARRAAGGAPLAGAWRLRRHRGGPGGPLRLAREDRQGTHDRHGGHARPLECGSGQLRHRGDSRHHRDHSPIADPYARRPSSRSLRSRRRLPLQLPDQSAATSQRPEVHGAPGRRVEHGGDVLLHRGRLHRRGGRVRREQRPRSRSRSRSNRRGTCSATATTTA